MVHKSYYYGIKHIDFVVPKFDPNALGAHDAQGERVEENAAPRRPGAGDGSMYLSDSARMGLRDGAARRQERQGALPVRVRVRPSD